jgi:hypothetical protein
MAMAIKLLASGHLPSNPTNFAQLTAPVPSGKAQIIKNMRFFNTTAGSIQVTVAVNSTSTIGGAPDAKTILKQSIAAYTLLSDDKEITLEATQKLEYLTAAAGIDFVVCGIERDV